MVSILSKQHKELTIQRNTIECTFNFDVELEKTLNQEKGKIAALETELDRVNKRCQELEVRKIKCETPKKDDKNIENILDVNKDFFIESKPREKGKNLLK